MLQMIELLCKQKKYNIHFNIKDFKEIFMNKILNLDFSRLIAAILIVAIHIYPFYNIKSKC